MHTFNTISMNKLQAYYVSLNMLWSKWQRNRDNLNKYSSKMNFGKRDSSADGYFEVMSVGCSCHLYSNYKDQGGALCVSYWEGDSYRNIEVLIVTQTINVMGAYNSDGNMNILDEFMASRYPAIKHYLDEEIENIDWGLQNGVYGHR